jgi:hypothetical protein
MRLVLAIALALHGLAHLVGFLVPWGWAPAPAADAARAASAGNVLFGGRVVLGPGAARALAILWLVAAIAFVIVATAVWRDAAWWRPALLVTALASLALCVAWWPDARIGAAIDAVLLLSIGALLLLGMARVAA